VEAVQLRGREVRDDRERGLEVAISQRLDIREQRELPVGPDDGRLAELEVNIARAKVHRPQKDSIQVHGRKIGS
jgi:hypothetical protein